MHSTILARMSTQHFSSAMINRRESQIAVRKVIESVSTLKYGTENTSIQHFTVSVETCWYSRYGTVRVGRTANLAAATSRASSKQF